MAFALTACGQRELPTQRPLPARKETSIPPHAIGTPATSLPVDLLGLLQVRFGAAARLDASWQQAEDGATVTRRVCARRFPLEARGHTGLLAVCSDLDQDADADATSGGSIALLMFERTNSGWRAIAFQDEVESGVRGAVTNYPDVVRFGPSTWGFIDHGGAMNLGWMIEWDNYWAVRNDHFEEVASVNTTFDNEGTCERVDCLIQLEATGTMDARDRGEIWPLLVVRHGTGCGKPYDQRFRYTFDEARFRYPAPEGPPDIHCETTE